MKNVLFAVSMCLLLIPGLVQAGQPEPADVECVEGTPPEPIEVEFGEHTSLCAIDNPTDVDRFTVPVSAEDFGKHLRLNVTWRGGNSFYTHVEVWDSCGDKKLDKVSNPTTADILIPACEGDFLVLVSDDNNANTGTYIVQAERIPPVYAPTIAYDFPVDDSIVPVTDVDFLVFDGAQNTTIRLIITWQGGNNFYQHIEVWDPSWDPDEPKLEDVVDNYYSKDFLLTETGKYLVAISDNDIWHTGTYELEVNCLSLQGCPPTPTEGPPGDPSCSDGIDNDKDGFIDVEDSDCGCTEPADCDDSDSCTNDDCIDNQCQYSPINCDDTNACTEDTCDTVSGCVNTCNVGQSCPLPGSCAPVQGQCAIDGLECVCQAQ